MTLYALDDIDDAIEATRAFLTPFALRRWAKLALIVFFVGGGGSVNPLQFSGSTSSGTGDAISEIPSPSTALPSIGGTELLLIAVIAVILGLVFLGFMLLGSIFEFVFVATLRREDVLLRRDWRHHWPAGVRLFGFRVILGVLSLGLIGGLVVAALGPVFVGDGSPSIGLLLLALPLAFLTVIISSLLNGFTTAFVVPVMLLEERGVLASWRRFWPTLTGHWKQYLAYAIGVFILRLALGLAATVVTALAAVVVAIPLVIVGLIGLGLLSVFAVGGWVIIGLAVVVFLVSLFLIGLAVSVPVQTFLRYYALLILGDTNESFDLISERRQALRE